MRSPGLSHDPPRDAAVPLSSTQPGAPPSAPGWWNRQTQRTQTAPPKGMRVRVPHPAQTLWLLVGGSQATDGVAHPVHPHRVERAGDPGRRARDDDDLLATL